MVHAFKFDYHDKAYHFVWDNESGSLHNVDYVAFLYAKKKYAKLTDSKEIADFSVFPYGYERQEEQLCVVCIAVAPKAR